MARRPSSSMARASRATGRTPANSKPRSRRRQMHRPESVSPAGASGADAGSWVTCHVGQTGFRTEIIARSHRLTGDEPADVGGADAGPTPYEFLLMALGGCTAMTLRIYADRKGWPLQQATVSVRQARAHEPDCEICEVA